MAHLVRSISNFRWISSGRILLAAAAPVLEAAVSLTALIKSNMLFISQILIGLVYLENAVLCIYWNLIYKFFQPVPKFHQPAVGFPQGQVIIVGSAFLADVHNAGFLQNLQMM